MTHKLFAINQAIFQQPKSCEEQLLSIFMSMFIVLGKYNLYYSKSDRAKYVSGPYSQVSPYCVIRVEHQGKQAGRGAGGARVLGGARHSGLRQSRQKLGFQED